MTEVLEAPHATVSLAALLHIWLIDYFVMAHGHRLPVDAIQFLQTIVAMSDREAADHVELH